MEQDKNTQSTETADVDKNEVEAGTKSFTQDDLNELAGKIRKEAKENQEKAIADAVARAIEEERKNSKLTAEEREKEQKKKYEEELELKNRELTIREHKLEATSLLNEKKIPIELVDFIVELDMEKTKSNIDLLDKAYKKSVEEGVAAGLKGTPPKDFSTPPKETKEFKTGF